MADNYKKRVDQFIQEVTTLYLIYLKITTHPIVIKNYQPNAL
jgi:hypothetical protein